MAARPGNARFLNIPEKLSMEEYHARVKELRASVADQLPEGGCYAEDEWAARFLRAKKGDVKKAREMLLESLRWRLENKVDTHFERPPPDTAKIGKYLPHSILEETSKDGHVIYYERSGRTCIPAPDVISQDQLFHWKVDVSETLLAKTRASAANGGSGVGVAILDMEGLSLTTLNGHAHAMLKMLGDVEERHYPESLYKVVILNANVVFTTVWKVVRFFFSGELRDKLVICGADYEKTLYQYVEPELLPPCIKGGTSKLYEGQLWAGDLMYQEHLPKEGAHEGCNTKATVKAGATFDHAVALAANDTLSWRYTVEKNTIDFSVVSPTGKVVVPAVKFDGAKAKAPAEGEYQAREGGEYLLRFCNKAAWTASKVVRFSCSKASAGLTCP